MYTNNRDAYRHAFFAAWEKYKNNLSMSEIELQLVSVLLLHSEYHYFIENKIELTKDFSLEENPFFHLSLHLAIRDQLKLNKPDSIVSIYQQLIEHYQDAHHVEHLMMQCLSQALAHAQQTNGIPDENQYIQSLKNLLEK